ncbi:MAG: hypothetical protein KC483_02840 [Nitrosarchaeum sp.]|nr:hypothetical protein [Nitrosarchaeum sp.]
MECPSCKVTMVITGNARDKRQPEASNVFLTHYQCPACGYSLEKEEYSTR